MDGWRDLFALLSQSYNASHPLNTLCSLLQAVASAISSATGQTVDPSALQQGNAGAVSNAINQGVGCACLGGEEGAAGRKSLLQDWLPPTRSPPLPPLQPAPHAPPPPPAASASRQLP